MDGSSTSNDNVEINTSELFGLDTTEKTCRLLEHHEIKSMVKNILRGITEEAKPILPKVNKYVCID